MATRARETRNKTHHERSGGTAGGPWCVLLRVSRARACVQRRHRRARMYIAAAPGGERPSPPTPKKQGFRYFWLHSWPQGGVLACADGPINTLQYPENKNFLIHFCARCSRRHCRSGEKYFSSKSGPYGDSSHDGSVWNPEIAKTGEMPFPPGTIKMALFGSVARPRSPRQR